MGAAEDLEPVQQETARLIAGISHKLDVLEQSFAAFAATGVDAAQVSGWLDAIQQDCGSLEAYMRRTLSASGPFADDVRGMEARMRRIGRRMDASVNPERRMGADAVGQKREPKTTASRLVDVSSKISGATAATKSAGDLIGTAVIIAEIVRIAMKRWTRRSKAGGGSLAGR